MTKEQLLSYLTLVSNWLLEGLGFRFRVTRHLPNVDRELCHQFGDHQFVVSTLQPIDIKSALMLFRSNQSLFISTQHSLETMAAESCRCAPAVQPNMPCWQWGTIAMRTGSSFKTAGEDGVVCARSFGGFVGAQ